jgi:hypothetical protein
MTRGRSLFLSLDAYAITPLHRRGGMGFTGECYQPTAEKGADKTLMNKTMSYAKRQHLQHRYFIAAQLTPTSVKGCRAAKIAQ